MALVAQRGNRTPSRRSPWRQVARREVGLTWRYGFNLGPTLAYRLSPRRHTGEGRRVLGDLSRDGVAVTDADRLLGNDPCYDALLTAADDVTRVRAAEIGSARSGQAATRRKPYVFPVLGSPPPLDLASPFARFPLLEPVKGIVDAYFRLRTQVRYYNVWHTFPTPHAPSESQLWHRDQADDRLIVKLFLYLSDVDGGAGPFTYVPGSHAKGRLALSPPTLPVLGVPRTSDDQMADVIGRDRWRELTGQRGTIVLADTSGYHRGGLARDRDRLVYTCTFTSPASWKPWAFAPFSGGDEATDPAVAVAYGLRRTV